jgi:NAD(P)-dependent dehydrogenase (short-subunit alcohol dehydrogenase family)
MSSDHLLTIERCQVTDSFRLDGRVAVVTGAGGGLGQGICHSLVAAGASVAVIDRRTEEAEQRATELIQVGGNAKAFVADVSDKAAIDSTVANVADAFGRIDILVNNAAVYPLRPWTEISLGEWEEVQRTNVTGYFLCARAAYPWLARSPAGRIVNLASITVHGGWDKLLSYVTSKGAVMAFTRALARELGPESITVNSFAPGAFPTEAEKIYDDPEAYNAWVLERQSLKRRGTPDDIGRLMVFLASDASAFITGQMIEIDGGWVMH